MAETRLGLYGGSRKPYGSFAGKTEYVPPASKPYTSTFTRLALHGGARPPYASFAGKSTAAVVIPKTKGGRVRKKRRYAVEVDNEYFVFSTIFEVESFLAQVRATAEEQADRIVTTPVVKKPPRVAVKTRSGRVTTSKTLQQAVKRTQKAINRAYVEAAKRREVDQEISVLMQKAIQDEEETILMLLMG